MKRTAIITSVILLILLTSGLIGQIQTGGLTAQSGSTYDFSPATNTKFPGWHAGAFNSGAQSIPNNAGTALTYNTNAYDTSGIHSTSVNPTRFTVPAGLGGTWFAYCQVSFATSLIGASNAMALSMNINGTPTNNQVTAPVSIIFGPTLTLGVPLLMNAGDYMECIGYQATGGALNTAATTTLAALFRLPY